MSFEDKPLPNPGDQRPGTAGTEAAIRDNLLRASKSIREAEERLERAKRAERLYKVKKRSASARANRVEAKAHFREAFEHLGLSIRLAWSVVQSAPYVLLDKRELRRLQAESAESEPAETIRSVTETQQHAEGARPVARNESIRGSMRASVPGSVQGGRERVRSGDVRSID
ncbi:hypothetical protein B0H67DRAFT_644763 [Lasiosphaeris hirsuta]|uniref:Uncharacterized protein n=1 Tax=Lasiosphaeris hirsuta TaxID=260670 RepID=A0AA40AFM5_9PEZI|nr:hypothetical protein B0H67DRAFT_644763 [Lasiosphaeris hirsuta]